MIKKKLASIVSVFTTAAIVMTGFTSCSSSKTDDEPTTEYTNPVYTQTTDKVKKSETVYANLNPDGSPRYITVTDHLHTQLSGVKVLDSTDLKNVKDAKGHNAPVSEDGKMYWNISSTDLYYNGTSDKQMPVTASIKYYLNETEVSPSDLAGKSGKFKMEIKLTNNISEEVEINGKKITIYNPVVVAGGMILDYGVYSNIKVSTGMSLGTGSNEMVGFVGAPGLNQSLGIDTNNEQFKDLVFPDTFTLTADVTNFESGDMYLVTLPVCAMDLDVNLPQSLDDVKDVLNKINALKTTVAQVDPNNVIQKFLENQNAFSELTDTIKNASKLYNDNKALFDVMGKTLTADDIETLKKFLNTVQSSDIENVISTVSNVPLLKKLLSSLSSISEGMEEVSPILEKLQKALDDPEVAKALENLPQTMQELEKLSKFLDDNEELIDVLTKLMSTSTMTDLTNALNTLAQSSSSDSIKLASSDDELIARTAKWVQLGQKNRIYTSAPDYMETNLMFICKVDPISLPKAETTSEKAE